MIYVVAGFPRTGTSCMMQCLQAAGLPLSYNLLREAKLQALKNADGYEPNPRGFYEHEWQDLRRMGFTEGLADGEAIKLRLMDTLILVPRDTTVIWMHRDWDDVLRSYEHCEFKKDFGMFDAWPQNAIDLEKRNREILEDRKCVKQIIDVNYEDLIADPVAQLARIPGIEAAAAAQAVRAELHRHKKAG